MIERGRHIAAGVRGVVLRVVALMGVEGCLLAAWGREELFVANDDMVTLINHSITVYARTASGDSAPLRTLSGVARD